MIPKTIDFLSVIILFLSFLLLEKRRLLVLKYIRLIGKVSIRYFSFKLDDKEIIRDSKCCVINSHRMSANGNNEGQESIRCLKGV